MAPLKSLCSVLWLATKIIPLTLATYHDDLTNIQTLIASLTPSEQAERERTLAAIAREPEQEIDNDHPRYRLLWAMYGFDRHFDRAVNDVNSARDRYAELDESHRDVSRKYIQTRFEY
jgi:hypothetical protein